MYLPYLRGRQFELLALRELIEKDLISNKVIPIIEPIKPTPTLIKTLDAYSEKKRYISIIMNPKVGKFISNIKLIRNTPKDSTILKPLVSDFNNEKVIKSYIMNKKIISKIQSMPQKNELLIINYTRDTLEDYLHIYSENAPRYTLIPDDRDFRRSVHRGKILFGNKFNKQEKNADYLNIKDEFFSNDHRYFEEEGYSGFSDYSIVGEEFSESGFAPLAVAIHIVYFDSKKDLRIKHFVSDSNEDISDPAGKFGEALTKLVQWMDSSDTIMTEALKQFRNYYSNGKYPGLGTVKKLSLMHHIQLISMYLQGEI